MTDRKGFIGGSDIGVILGLSPFKDPFALYLEKRGEIDPEPIEISRERRGRILEPAIAEIYAEEYGATIVPPGVTPAIVFDRVEKWRRAQIDAWERTEDGEIPLEIKTASEFTRGRWGPSGTDEAPTYYCAQLHWQMIHADAPRGKIVALVGSDDLRVYPIARDPKIDEYLLDSARAFWRCVTDGVPPAVDFDHPSTVETLARLFNKPNPLEILQADESLRHWRGVLLECAELVKRYEGARDAAKAHLLAAMKNSGLIDFGDGQVFERKLVKRKGYVVADCEYVDGRFRKSKAGESTPALTSEV